jgi:hypothetical protein
MTFGNSGSTTSAPAPFDTPTARARSTYSAVENGRLVRVASPDVAVPPLVDLVHDAFRGLVLSRGFSCVGARSAVRRGTYRFAVLGDMGSAESTETLAWDLQRFTQEVASTGSGLTTFAAAFTGPPIPDETRFEELLWAQLRALHALDRREHAWDPLVSADPRDPTFAFSFAGQALFVVGLHAGSSRWSRRFAWPTLIFNPHVQFRRLRADGSFGRVQEATRRREVRLQGSLNPNLSDFGERSEARQYSGRAVDDTWRCPFPVATDGREG